MEIKLLMTLGLLLIVLTGRSFSAAAAPPSAIAPPAGTLAATQGRTAKPDWLPGYEHIVNSIKMELVHIPPGSYRCYGNDVTATYHLPKPKGFQVNVTEEFYIGVYEVTQEQYLIVMGLNPGLFNEYPDKPVNKVSWNDAMTFCRRLSALPEEKAAGRVYSLPSEREWQFAARAGSDELFTYGTSDELAIATIAVCRDPYDIVPQGVSQVGHRNPNRWGLYDVLGNVGEWVLDAWPADTPLDAVPATASAAALDKGGNRVIVGGGWENDFRMSNLACRASAPPTQKSDNIGFRVRCRIIPPPAK